MSSADQPGTPPSRATAARQSRHAQHSYDPLQASAYQRGADQAVTDVAPIHTVNNAIPGHKTLTVRTSLRTDPSHPLAAQQSSSQKADTTAGSPTGGPPRPVLSPIASRDSQESFAGQVLAHARSIGAKVHHDAVSFAAIAKNPSLARQARAELDEHQHTTAIEKIDTDGPVASSAFYAHDAEVERQWAALEAVNADTKEEGTLNKELSFLICARLEASRKSSERLLGVLQVAFVDCHVSATYISIVVGSSLQSTHQAVCLDCCMCITLASTRHECGDVKRHKLRSRPHYNSWHAYTVYSSVFDFILSISPVGQYLLSLSSS